MDYQILLVEDNADHAVLVQAMLDYRNIRGSVFVSQSLGEAKSYLLGEWPFNNPTHHPPPELIVLDHWLEDGTGLELLSWLAETPGVAGLPVVVFTACRDAEVQRTAEALGVVGFFLKPEGFDALGEAIEKLVRPTLEKKWTREPKEPGSAQTG